LASSFNQNHEDVQFGRQIAKQMNNQSLATSPVPYNHTSRQSGGGGGGINQQQYKMSDFNSAEFMPQKPNDTALTFHNSNHPSRFNYNNNNNNNTAAVNDKRRSDERNGNQQLAGYKSPTFTNNNGRGNNHFFGSTHSAWSGRLPPKVYATSSVYSRKVFLGGLPWDVNQQVLVSMLSTFGQVKLEIPGKDQKHPRVSTKTQERNTPGYVYIIYEHETSVQRLLAQCRKEMKNGGEHFYFNISIPTYSNNNCSINGSFRQNQSGRHNNVVNNGQNGAVITGVKTKEVEVIPWNQVSSHFKNRNRNSKTKKM
jgi:hypothetical protein